MPNISKVKNKKVKKTKKLTNLPVTVKSTRTKTQKIKHSPIDYYNCLLTKAQQGWYDPLTGKKKQITACCQDCKINAPKLQAQRQQEISKLVVSYHQVGESLKKLLKPIE